MYNVQFGGFGAGGAFTMPTAPVSSKPRFVAAGPRKPLIGNVRMQNAVGKTFPLLSGSAGAAITATASDTQMSTPAADISTSSVPSSEAGTQTVLPDSSGSAGPEVQPMVGPGQGNDAVVPVQAEAAPTKKGLRWWGWTLIAVGGVGVLGGVVYAIVRAKSKPKSMAGWASSSVWADA